MVLENHRIFPSLSAAIFAFFLPAIVWPAPSRPQSDPWRALQKVERTIPDAGDHPGNIFLEGEEVLVKVPPQTPRSAAKWRILDDRSKTLAQGSLDRNADSVPKPIRAGKLGIGWYRVEFLDASGECVAWTAAAVLARLRAPVPQDSPVCVDSATAWFAGNDPAKQEAFARLAALAGVNWIRDRLRWGDIEPRRGEFAENTTYDSAAAIENRLGLKVLQVFHLTPRWAADKKFGRGHFPPDLRDAYTFCRAMSRRFKGRVQAWEPWNEANIPNFGAHTVDEICSYQKAAYLGFKAGDPTVTVCSIACAGLPTRFHARGVLENETWPYFDTYNIHSYDWPDSYLELWAPAREAACGRPIWMSEADRGWKYETPPPWCDISRRGERLKAEYMAQSYACSLFAGCNRHFHFILGHYYETSNHVQFGLLRLDLTPRPAYVALAAVGRFLAGARCLGRLVLADKPEAHIYAFAARPDGKARDVLVAWAEKKADWPQRGAASVEWVLPEGVRVEAVYDYLGRSLGDRVPARLVSAPVFIILARGEASKLPLEKPPAPAKFRTGAPSPVVLQLWAPQLERKKIEERKWSAGYERIVPPGEEVELSIFAYNFGPATAKGTIAVEHLPEGWKISPHRWEVQLRPMERRRLAARFTLPAGEAGRPSARKWLKLRGDFGKAGRPALAFRLLPKE